jgi:fatty acid desaturase
VVLQRRIAFERKVSIAAHLSALALIWASAGLAAATRAYIVPVFFIFPIAFTLNRLGQHYDIDPADTAKWGTLMRGHWFWDFAFLNSNYHLEHHYFAGVPFYRLPALQRALLPFYERHRMRWQNYSGLLYGWLVENRAPHTNWSRDVIGEVRDAAVAAPHVGAVDLTRPDSRRSH